MSETLGGRGGVRPWLAAVGCCVAFAPMMASAQQKHTVSFDAPTASSHYTQQFSIDVGDAPGHQLRVFELQRKYGGDAPTIEGVRLKEAWIRGMTDFTEQNGPGSVYVVYSMANGDRIYARGSVTAHAVSGADGKHALKSLIVMTITGGTGKFLGVRGIVTGEILADPAAGTNANQTAMEYWMEK